MPSHSPPPSPSPSLNINEKLKNPFVRPRRRRTHPISFRARATTRASLTLALLCLCVFVVNEWRCTEYGCLSRIGFYGGESAEADGRKNIGGGAVLGRFRSGGKDGSEGMNGNGSETGTGKGKEDSQASVGGGGAWWWKPTSMIGHGQSRWAGDSNSQQMLDKDEEGGGDSDSLIDPQGILHAKYKDELENGSEKAENERTLKSTLDKERDSYLSAAARGKAATLPTAEQEPMHTTALMALAESSSSAPAPTAAPEKSGERHGAWLQATGQEDPVRVTRPATEMDRSRKEEHVNEVQFGAMDLSAGLGGAVA
ncbi:hypothetical protein K491DRAFT_686849 [Lophiostoma macrostomum CBS 122681]|uniref:Uncharacterized protein n=1 Tax=Lophiostoma macrostomum CBS 122681 TaxID=1314788 RepID=A0A6A6TQ09_9PLEO|nr:hypothetical protein K491DRAFT_686849 [Lophiostoma macrostomum CBS 122681]